MTTTRIKQPKAEPDESRGPAASASEKRNVSQPLDVDAKAATSDPPRRAPNRKGQAAEKLEALGLDAICEELLRGRYLSEIADELGIARSTMTTWIAADPERSARAREARSLAAEVFDMKALKTLEEVEPESSAHVAKARDIAHHYRWRASKVAPNTYGDRMSVDANLDVTEQDTEYLMKRLRQLLGITL